MLFIVILVAVLCIIAAIAYHLYAHQSAKAVKHTHSNGLSHKASDSSINRHSQNQSTPIKLAQLIISENSQSNHQSINQSNGQSLNELSIRSPHSSSTRSTRALPAPSPFLWTRPSTTIDSSINHSINQLIQGTPRNDSKRPAPSIPSIDQSINQSNAEDSTVSMELDKPDQSTNKRQAVISLSDALYSSYSANKSNKKSRNHPASPSIDEVSGMEIDAEASNQSVNQSRKRKSNAAVTPTHRKRPSSDHSDSQRAIKRRTDQSIAPLTQNQPVDTPLNQPVSTESLDESMTEEPVTADNLDSHDSADALQNYSEDQKAAEPINQSIIQPTALVVKEPLLDESALQNYQKRKSTRSQMNSRRSVNQSSHLFDEDDDESVDDPIDLHRNQQVQKLLEEGYTGNRRRVNQPIPEQSDVKSAADQSVNQSIHLQLNSQSINLLAPEQSALSTGALPAPIPVTQSTDSAPGANGTTTATPSLFGAPSAASTGTSFSFGAPAPSSTAAIEPVTQPSMPTSFSFNTSATSTAAAVSFNFGATTSSAAPSMFGAATPASTQPATIPPPQTSTFGAPSTSTAFGIPQSTPAFSGSSTFGASQSFNAPQSTFGTAPSAQPILQPTPASGSSFGAPQSTFGAPQSTFCAAPSSQPNFSASPFNATQQSFGAPQTAFGGAQSQPQQPAFGGLGGAQQQPAFGSVTQQPPFGDASQPAFGGFGAQPSQPAPTGTPAFKSAPARKPTRGGRRK